MGIVQQYFEKTQKTGATFKDGSLSMEATTKRLKKVTCVFFPSLEMHHGWIDYTDIRRGSVAKNPARFLIKYVITFSNDLNLFWTDWIYEQKASHTEHVRMNNKKNKDQVFWLEEPFCDAAFDLHFGRCKNRQKPWARAVPKARDLQPCPLVLGPWGWKCKAWKFGVAVGPYVGSY